MRENSSSTTEWWQWSSWFSGRASLSTTEEEELEEERAAPGKGVRLPSLSLTIYRGKGGGEGALGYPRGGVAAIGETLDGFGRPHPWETCPPSREGWLP